MLKAHTCKGITIINMCLSISDNTCLTNFIPVPMRTIVMNKTDPLSLEKIKTKLKKQVKLVPSNIQMNCIVNKRPCSNMLSFDLNEMEI